MPNVEMWKKMTREERKNFISWVDSEIKRLKAGGAVPDCFRGTSQEMIESLEDEKSVYLGIR